MFKKIWLAVFFGVSLSLSALDYDLERVTDWQPLRAQDQVSSAERLTALGDHLILKGSARLVSARLYPVQAGQYYEIETEARALQNGAATIKVGLEFVNGSGLPIKVGNSSVIWAAQGQLPTGAFGKYEGVVRNVPATAKMFRMLVQIENVKSTESVELKDLEIDVEP